MHPRRRRCYCHHRDIAIKLPDLGTVTPLATVNVKTQISGQLQQIAFREGQLVHGGTSCADRPAPFYGGPRAGAGKSAARSGVLANARVDQQRFQDILAQGLIPAQQLDTQRALVQQYEGTVASDEAQVSAARLNLQYTHIVAPASGQVGLGRWTRATTSPRVTPTHSRRHAAATGLRHFPAPEDNLPAIRKRLRDGAVLAVEAYDRANTDKLADGRLQSIDNEIDTTTGTIKMRALFDNQDGALFANQFVNIRLLQDILKDQVIVPIAAVQHGAPNSANSTFVYLVHSDSTVSVRPIAIGTADGERVRGGLGSEIGDTVVTEGGDRLRDGATVILPPAAAARAPAATGTSAEGGAGHHRRPQGGGPGSP